MTRKFGPPAGGGAQGVAQIDREVDVTTARSPSVDRIEVGRYHDLVDGEPPDISPQQRDVVYASVPPGDSFESDHYATSIGESVSNSDAELMAALIIYDGPIYDGFTTEYTWERPDGVTAYSGEASVDDPGDFGYSYWAWTYFYTWIGRGFSTGGTAEVVGPGAYQCTFDAPFSTDGVFINAVGPHAVDCDIPNEIGENETRNATVTIENDGSGDYDGEVRLIRCDDERDVLASRLFTIDANETTDVDVAIRGSDIGFPFFSTPICAYVVV